MSELVRMTARYCARRFFRTGIMLGVMGWAASGFAAEPASGNGTPAELAPAGDPATPVDPNDLGRGLRFLQIAATLPSQKEIGEARGAAALVIDLRIAQESPGHSDLLDDLVGAQHGRPVFVLIGPQTPPSMADRVSARSGILTVGAANAGLSVGLGIAVDADECQRAATEIANGRPPGELIGTRIEKTRFDEARLTKRHANGFRELPPADADTRSDGAEAAPPEVPPPADVLLQRAVFLHRALLALGRIREHT